MIGGSKFLTEKQSTLMKPKESAEDHQTLFPRERVGTRLRLAGSMVFSKLIGTIIIAPDCFSEVYNIIMDEHKLSTTHNMITMDGS